MVTMIYVLDSIKYNLLRKFIEYFSVKMKFQYLFTYANAKSIHCVLQIYTKSERFNVNGGLRRESIIGFLCNLACRKCI